ncbi:hypothetical protein [Kitasatospora brasiliensis]|uniref:hypothetical protein n=1 Tax=Kitasatospora brasiliensis TaxID=3058040 RepID=UPI00293166B9|nr:hypothetical protein [Kitasatospora sp. K002]
MAAATVLALGAAACTEQWGGGDTAIRPVVTARPAPTGGGYVLSQAAPASAQWIADALNGFSSLDPCPRLSRQNMIVLDPGDPHHPATVAWLGNGTAICLGALMWDLQPSLAFASSDSIDYLADQTRPTEFGNGRFLACFAIFPGAVWQVAIKDDDHAFGPPHQRTVDYGGGREFTIVEYADLKPGSGTR